MPGKNIDPEKIRQAENILRTYGIPETHIKTCLKAIGETTFDTNPYNGETPFTVFPVNVAAVIHDGMKEELPFILTFYVKLSDNLSIKGAPHGVRMSTALDQIKTAAMITYLADYERNVSTSCNDFNWGDYINVKESIPVLDIYASKEDAEKHGSRINDEPINLLVNHDELLGIDSSLVPCKLVTLENDNYTNIGVISYDPVDGVVHAPHKEGQAYWLKLPDDRLVPIYKDKREHPDGFTFG